MNRNRFWFFALFFFTFFATARSPSLTAETLTLTLEDAVERALDKNLGLKKSAIDLTEAEYSAGRLWSEIFPSFSLNAGLDFLPRTPLFTEPGFSYMEEGLSYSLGFGLSISLNASIHSSMKRIELAYRSELLSYENARRQLEIQVTKNFLSLNTMKENLALMEESLTLAEQRMEKTRVARENGLASELTWLNSRLSAETARYELVSARGTYQNELGEFLSMLGMEAGTDLDFSGTVEIAPVNYDPEELILGYLPKRPDIISLRQEIENLEYAKNQSVLSSRSPTLSLSAQWSGAPSANEGLGGQFTDSVSGSIRLNIPLDSWIPGTGPNQNLRAASAGVEKAKLDLEDAETSAKTQIRSLVSNLHNTWESLGVARMRVEIAVRTADASEEGFRSGTVELQDLEDTRGELADARQRLLEGELSYQTLLLDLAAALNVAPEELTGQALNGGKDQQ